MPFGGEGCFSANLGKINWPFCAVEFESGLTLQFEKINQNFVDYFHASEKVSERNFPLPPFKSPCSPKILGGILSHHKNVKMSFLAKKIHCELLETQKNCKKSQKNIQ